MSYVFHGSLVAMVTPFRNGKVDEAKVRELVEFHVTNGTDALVPCGTTGESPTLSHDEHKRLVEIVVEAAAGRIAVVAGTGSNSTAEAIDLTKHAARAGARVRALEWELERQRPYQRSCAISADSILGRNYFGRIQWTFG